MYQCINTKQKQKKRHNVKSDSLERHEKNGNCYTTELLPVSSNKVLFQNNNIIT